MSPGVSALATLSPSITWLESLLLGDLFGLESVGAAGDQVGMLGRDHTSRRGGQSWV